MQTWLTIEEFCAISSLSEDKIHRLIDEDKLNSKYENDTIYIEVNSKSKAMAPHQSQSLAQSGEAVNGTGNDFLEKTIGTILNLHEKVVTSKEETVDVLKNENQFLKDALLQMQELYDEDRKTIETLREQIKFSQDELESVRRKYRLMWGRAVETGNKLEDKKKD